MPPVLPTNNKITASHLSQFEPLSSLSHSRLQELAGLCFVEKVSKEIDPLRLNMAKAAQLMFLLSGDLGLRFQDGSKKILRAGMLAAKHSIDSQRLALQDAIALTDIQVLRIDSDLLDIMMTWDQLSRLEPLKKEETVSKVSKHEQTSQKPESINTAAIDLSQKNNTSQWMRDTDMFSADRLKSGIFSRLPTANIEEMFRRMQHVELLAGQVVVQQGAEGEYYYLLQSGEALMTRMTVSQNRPEAIRTLFMGDFFGEEAVVSEGKSNVTVTMQTDGAVLRLKKTDFNELLKAPLIHQVNKEQAQKDVLAGNAVLVDVRFPSEFKFDGADGAMNLPLNNIRNLIADLDKTKQYITYCQTGRRSSAAAFILIEQGFDALLLKS